MPKLLAGNMLIEETQRDVLARFANRRTREHYTGALHTRPGTTDAEWLAVHAFYVNQDGRLSGNHTHCVMTYRSAIVTQKEITS